VLGPSPPEPPQHEKGMPSNHHFPRHFDGGKEMDQSSAEGFAAALAEANARSAADTGGTGIGLDSDYAESLAGDDGLIDAVSAPRTRTAINVHTQNDTFSLPTIPTTSAHISFQESFQRQLEKLANDMQERQNEADLKIATIRQESIDAIAASQQNTQQLFDMIAAANLQAVTDRNIAAQAAADSTAALAAATESTQKMFSALMAKFDAAPEVNRRRKPTAADDTATAGDGLICGLQMDADGEEEPKKRKAGAAGSSA